MKNLSLSKSVILLVSVVLNMITAETVSIQLIGGSTPNEGNVYVKRGSDWGLVCDDGWDIRAGNVVCKQLGYKKVKRVTEFNSFDTSMEYSVFLDEVNCGGFEKNLGECKHQEWFRTDCNAGEAAGVICDPQTTAATSPPEEATEVESAALVTDPRLAAMERFREMIRQRQAESEQEEISEELKIEESEESEVSTTRSRLEEILARSRQQLQEHRESLDRDNNFLGETNPSRDVPREEFGALEGLTGAFEMPADAPVTEDGAATTGTLNYETRYVSDDEIAKAERMMNELIEDSAIRGYRQSARPYDVQIIGGRNQGEGFIKVFLDNGKSGAICSDNWGIFEAMVVCRETGNEYAERALVTDFFRGAGEDKVFYEVNCDGHESSLADCEYKLTDDHGIKCSSPTQVAGVICTTAAMPDLVPNIWTLQTSIHIDERPLSELQCAQEENCLSSSAYTSSDSYNYNQLSHPMFVLPDLIPNITIVEESLLLQDRYLGHLTCALEENCLASTAYQMQETYRSSWTSISRRLLRFSSDIYNNGTADFRPKQHRSSWEWHACHMHYHSMSTFSHYDILDSHGNRVAEGHKASFCLEDVECDHGKVPRYRCQGFGEQGISVGCADVYKYDIDCQWIDITDLQPGAYIFKLNVNPEMAVPELSFDNNAAVCELTYTGYSVKLNDCVLARG